MAFKPPESPIFYPEFSFVQKSRYSVVGFSDQVVTKLQSSQCMGVFPYGTWVLFQAHSGCWQNCVPCGYRKNVFIFFFIVNFRPFSASGGCPQVLVAWLSTESAPKMTICFLPGQEENISAA